MIVRRWVALSAVMLLVAALAPAASAAGYRLLQLNGNLVKWGNPVLGRGAVISWALLDKTSRYSDLKAKILATLFEEAVGAFSSVGRAYSETVEAYALQRSRTSS